MPETKCSCLSPLFAVNYAVYELKNTLSANKAENIMIKWHRLFGITLTDFFTGTAYNVELEKDLSLKQQLLDVLIIKKNKGALLNEIPDGLENLGKYNLMTYKSHQQALNAWALDEFTGHFVNSDLGINSTFAYDFLDTFNLFLIL